MTIKKNLFLFLIFSLALLVLGACSSSEEDTSASADGKNKTNLSIGSYQPGVAHHSVASGLASVITEQSDMNITVRPFSGPKAWYPLMDKGDIDLGLTDYTVNWAMQGINGHEESFSNIRTLVIGNDVKMVGYTVREDSGIDSVKDLKGKKVAIYTASPESFNPILEVQLQSVGLTWDDVEEVPVSDLGQGIEALREGRVDAAFTGDPSVGLFLEVDNAIGIKGLNLADVAPEDFDDFPEELKGKMPEISPGLEPAVADSGFLKEPTVVFQEPLVSVVASHLSEDVVYDLVKTLYENYEDLHPLFTWLEDWNPDQMFREDPPVPYHDGAIKYFKEIGVWTEEADKNHEELLGLIND